MTLNKVHVLALNQAHGLRLNKAHVLRLNTKKCQRSQPTAHLCGFLCVGCEHWAYLSNETSALLRAKACALLRRKTCAVLRARTYALLRSNAKVATFGGHHEAGRPSASPLCGFLCASSEHSTCPGSQYSTCLASEQGRCLGSQQGACLASEHSDMPSVHSQHKE